MAVHLCNAYTLALARSDGQLAQVLREADLNLADGTPLAWLGRQQGLRGPVRGSDLLREVVERGARSGVRHYLYGGGENVAQLMAARLYSIDPGIHVVGAETPPFRDISDEELQELAARIRATQADIVWIGIGTPKQDFLVARLAPLLARPVVPIGAAFDFWAGIVEEAPRFLQGTGLEWIYRLTKEPKRLWRRYAIGNVVFIASVLEMRLRSLLPLRIRRRG